MPLIKMKSRYPKILVMLATTMIVHCFCTDMAGSFYFPIYGHFLGIAFNLEKQRLHKCFKDSGNHFLSTFLEEFNGIFKSLACWNRFLLFYGIMILKNLCDSESLLIEDVPPRGVWGEWSHGSPLSLSSIVVVKGMPASPYAQSSELPLAAYGNKQGGHPILKYVRCD